MTNSLKIFNECRIKYFEYFYMVVMVIYMGQMTSGTSRMVGNLSGNPIPLLLPLFLTLVLILRNRIRWVNKGLFGLFAVFTVWSVLILIKYDAFKSTEDLSYIFFLFYAILIAYIHVKVYGKLLLPVYEHIMVWLCAISLVFWVLNVALYDSLSLSFLPETSKGWNILYFYNWVSPDKAISDSFALTLRNTGCSWEPGRFAIMVGLALFANLTRCGIKFRNNKSAWIILAALISTQSTTGFIIALVLYTVFAVSRLSFRNIIITVCLLVPLWLFVSKLDFMQKKIAEQLDFENSMTEMNDSFDYSQSQFADDEYLGSLGRFESFYFDMLNLSHNPVLGYSRNTKHSYFYQNLSSNFCLTGGLARTFASYGIPLAILLFIILGVSSLRLADEFRFGKHSALFLVILISTVSYDVWCVPVFTAFWLYGLFVKKL